MQKNECISLSCPHISCQNFNKDLLGMLTFFIHNYEAMVGKDGTHSSFNL